MTYLPPASILRPADFIGPSFISDIMPASIFRELPVSVPEGVAMDAFSIITPALCRIFCDLRFHFVFFVHYGINNKTVMECSYHGSPLIFKLLKQPYNNSYRILVQGRSWFIEKQQARRPDHSSCYIHPLLFSSAKAAGIGVKKIGWNVQSLQELSRPGPCLVQ